MLKEFRSIDVYWDKATRRIYEEIRSSSSDEKGRKLTVQIVNDGQIQDLTNVALNLYWETQDGENRGLDPFEPLDAENGIYELYFRTGMLKHVGKLNAHLHLVDTTGAITSEPFTIVVFSGVDVDAMASDDELSALNQALIEVQNVKQSLGDIQDLQKQISDLQAFVGYTDDDIYGVEVDFKNKKFTRLAGAVNKTPGEMFDNVQAFGGRRRCNLADDGTVNAYHGELGYAEDGSNGQVMVEQPKFYYRVVPLELEKIVDGKGFHMRKARYYVSDTKKDGFKLHPAFIRNGKEKNFIYLSAFEATLFDNSAGIYITNDDWIGDFNADKLASIGNAKPISGIDQNLTRANTRKLANNRGTGWEQSYAATVSATQLLFTIEYASMNTQSKIGMGVMKTDDATTNMAEPTGATTLLGNESGSVSNGSISYRGEENFWMNIWTWVDGINVFDKSNIYIADHGFIDDNGDDPYKDAGITAARDNGYISAFGYNEEFDWLLFASETLGDSSLPVGDYLYQSTAGGAWKVARLGGTWTYSSYGGGFCWHVNGASSNRSRVIGGRLVYVPDAA